MKNEAADILSWLAWHAAMGCRTFIIYDDHSQDGTWEIINRAGDHLDVRAYRTDQSTARFTVRQMQSYLDALSRHGAEFEWLGFIDSDEFVSTENNETLDDFLMQFPDAHAVALNWCNYGSNGHALRPTIPVLEAFTRHSDRTSPINRHVKSFVRTSKFRGHFRNVHYFDVDDDYYLDSAGRTISWSETKGITAAQPDWFGAKIMHYQCRSMEHFVERLKLRTDVPATTETWRHYDLNDHVDVHIRPLLGKFHYHYKILRDALNLSILRKVGLPAGGDLPDREVDRSGSARDRAFFVKTYHGSYISCGDDDHRVRHRPASHVDGQAIIPAVLVMLAEQSSQAVLYLPRPGSWLEGESRRGMLLVYNVTSHEDGRMHLRNPVTDRIMCAMPIGMGGGPDIGQIDVDRQNANDWEKMTLVPVSEEPMRCPNIPDIRNMPARIPSAAEFLAWVRASPAEDIQPVLDVVLQAMSRVDRLALARAAGLENLR